MVKALGSTGRPQTESDIQIHRGRADPMERNVRALCEPPTMPPNFTLYAPREAGLGDPALFVPFLLFGGAAADAPPPGHSTVASRSVVCNLSGLGRGHECFIHESAASTECLHGTGTDRLTIVD